ncbi:MAG: MFS transporter [Acidobacteria bacterium]|nr:MFS transporter [Acidobacteriota bacterium]
MYQVDAAAALRQTVRTLRGRRFRPQVSRNVVALGFTSLLTDVSSEMVATVLPIYLVLYLGLTPLQYGLVDGLYHGMTALLRLAGGFASDRTRRDKEVAAVGYGTSALCRIGLLGAGGAWPVIAAIVAVDRAAKGLRAAPRDALISLSSGRAGLATSFGVHRALDSTGAMLGPLVALAILSAAPDAFDLVFVASFAVAVVGVGVLWLFVRRARGLALDPGTPLRPARAIRALFATRGFAALTCAGTLLGLATVSDGFLYLVLQQRTGLNPGLFPLLYVGTAGSFLLLALPAGMLADRFGRRTTFLAGHGVLLLAYLIALPEEASVGDLVVCIVLLGGYYALTEGVLMALASAILPAEVRGTGLALLTTMTSLGRLAASVAFGAVWAGYGPTQALTWFLIALGGATVLATAALRGSRGQGARDVTT